MDLAQLGFWAWLYKDLASPSVKAVGGALGDEVKRGMQLFLKEARRLGEQIPVERRIEPNPHVVGPLLEAARFTVQEPELRRMFNNLLQSSMDSKTASSAHPSFVEIIKQMNSEEARMIQYIAHGAEMHGRVTVEMRLTNGKRYTVLPGYCEWAMAVGCSPEREAAYVDNLLRLQLIVLPPNVTLHDNEAAYEELAKRALDSDQVRTRSGEMIVKYKLAEGDFTFGTVRGVYIVTEYGKLFAQACMLKDGSKGDSPTKSQT